ncbi:kelch-like protein 12 isoform X2 [Branchiostoma floridae]|uniref:Kelch-like protein 12 isoform X2 n=1 Tax=Branchiostoma floridae TaxID=7739 RepID=A0A9J7MMN2_BRAFL|nr:kelch-like protein 12 isoform X2 [Branchiostoma floridae]
MAAADQDPHARNTFLPRSYQDSRYLNGFLGIVDDLQKTGVLQDVVLEVEGRRFPCHRLVLSAASPYFRAMFTSDMAESRQKTVVLQGLDAGMFEEILSYIYSGTLNVSLDKVQPLYQAADLLQLDYVRDTCSSYMATNVERSTCVDLYKFADVFSVDVVRKHCLQLIYRNFSEVASSEEFCSLSVNQLIEIISEDWLDVKEETTVWEAVVRWVQHSREDRSREMLWMNPREGTYIRHRYDITPMTGTATSDNDIFILAEHSRETYALCKYSHAGNKWERKSLVCREDRDNKKYFDFLMEINGQLFYLIVSESVDRVVVLKKHNQHTDTWHNCSTPQLDGQLDWCFAVSCNQHIYLFTMLCGTEIQCYDPRTDQWCDKTPPPPSEYTLGYNAVAMGTEIFCTDQDFNTTMVYNTESDSWQILQGCPDPGNRTREYDGVPNLFVMENQLHILVAIVRDRVPGEGTKLLHLVYVYDRSADAWRDLNVALRDKKCYAHGDLPFPVARMCLAYLKGA